MPRGYTEIGGTAAADDAECCLVGGMDPNVKGGIIGGNIAAGPFQQSTAVVEPFPKSVLIGPTVYNIDAIQPIGAYYEVYMERFNAGGTLVTGPLQFLINAAISGQPQGSVINARGWIPIHKGMAIQAASTQFGPSPANILGWATEVRGRLRCQPMMASGLGSVPAGQTRYCLPFTGQANNTVNQTKFTCPGPGVIDALVVRTSNQQSGGGTLVVTLVKNGTDSALTYAIPASTNAGTFWNEADSVSVAEDDVIWWKVVNNGSGGSATIVAIDAMYTLDTAGDSAILVFPNPAIAGPDSNSTRYYGAYYPNSGGAAATTEGPARRPLPRAGTGKKLKLFISDSSTETCTYTIMANGVATTMTASVGAGVSGAISGTGTHVFDEGDEISLRVVMGNTIPTTLHTNAAFILQDA